MVKIEVTWSIQKLNCRFRFFFLWLSRHISSTKFPLSQHQNGKKTKKATNVKCKPILNISLWNQFKKTIPNTQIFRVSCFMFGVDTITLIFRRNRNREWHKPFLQTEIDFSIEQKEEKKTGNAWKITLNQSAIAIAIAIPITIHVDTCTNVRTIK